MDSAGVGWFPPISCVIRCDIQRGAFLVFRACLLLDSHASIRHDPVRTPVWHGRDENLGTQLPSKCIKPLPHNLLITCKCEGGCATRICSYRTAGIICVIFLPLEEKKNQFKTSHSSNNLYLWWRVSLGNVFIILIFSHDLICYILHSANIQFY